MTPETAENTADEIVGDGSEVDWQAYATHYARATGEANLNSHLILNAVNRRLLTRGVTTYGSGFMILQDGAPRDLTGEGVPERTRFAREKDASALAETLGYRDLCVGPVS